MKRLVQFALVLAVVLPLLTPGMACTLPNAHLSAREHACCTQMQGKCGSMAKASAQGCCQKVAPTAANWNAAVQTRAATIAADLAAPAPLLRAALLPLPLALPGDAPFPVSSPPLSPPSAVSILRV